MSLFNRFQTPAFARLIAAALLLATLAQPVISPVLAAGPAAAPQGGCALQVANLADTGVGSLRDTLACAAAGQTVTFAPGLAGGTLTLTTGAIGISQGLEIDASAAPGIKIDGNNAGRIFNITATGPVTLTALILQHGSAAGNGGAIVAGAASPLTLQQVDVLSSTTTAGSGGGVATDGALAFSGGRVQGNACTSANCRGGGLWTNAALTLTGTVVISNTSVRHGGGAYAEGAAALTNSLFQGNTCTEVDNLCLGGGLYTESSVALTSTQFLSNTSSSDGGGVYATGAAALTGGRFQGNRCTVSACEGGGLHTVSTLVLTGTEFISNTSRLRAGGAYALLAAVLNNGRFERNACTLGNCVGGGLQATASLTVTGTEFISNTAHGGGGGVYAEGAVTLTNARFQSNRCAQGDCYGGGLLAQSTLTLTGTEFMSNTSVLFGGGAWAGAMVTMRLSSFQGNACTAADCYGGGLLASSSANIGASSFSGNQAGGYGGGLSHSGPLALFNVTLSGNTAGVAGGGVYDDGGSALWHNVTVAGNLAASGAGLLAEAGATVELTNSLFANNSGGNCAGQIDVGSHNLEWPGATCAAAGPTAGFTTADPLLAPLALNAPGTTWTHALLPGSRARDSGDPATCNGPLVNNVDQRGVTRPINGDVAPAAVCDIGAFEAAPEPLWYVYLPLARR